MRPQAIGRRAVVIALAVLGIVLARAWWLAALGRSLTCEAGSAVGEAVLLDNFDNEYGLYKWGAEFQRAGKRVLVPITVTADRDEEVAGREVAAAFARVAGLSRWDMITVREQEPVSLNTASCVRDVLLRERITSVTLVSHGFRSRRSDLVYRTVLSERGIAMSCLPVFADRDRSSWTATWHGIEDVSLQFLKLQYYRFWVMPKHRAARRFPPAHSDVRDRDACRVDRIGM